MIRHWTVRAGGLLVALLNLGLAVPAASQEWSSCSSDLDSLRRRASDASSNAEDADSAQRKFKSAEDELRQCVQMPQVFDLLRDGCRMKRSDYESARSDYRSKLEDLKSGLDDVDSKIRSAGSSCGFDFSRVVGPPRVVPQGVQKPDVCAVYLRYKERLPAQSLIDMCSKQMPADQCRKCLE
jgi:hypothetical protein